MIATPIHTARPRIFCPLCADRPEGCEACERYTCAGCKRRRPWDDGAGDDMPGHCDACWARKHKTTTRAA